MQNTDQLKALHVLEQTINAIRKFFDGQHFHEVIAPVLHSALPIEPTIYPFSTTWHTNEGDQTLYLATSPESYLKKLLAAGLGNCYAIGHSFRNLESTGSRHHPEFLMLEWYREKAKYEQIMIDLEQLVAAVATNTAIFSPNPLLSNMKVIFGGNEVNLRPPFPRYTLAKLFQEKVGVTIESVITDQQMTAFAQRRGYSTENATWEQLFNQIFLNEIEPSLDLQPFFLTDFPARLSPLCKPVPGNPHLAQRFEFFIAGLEIANGNTEETDALAVSEAFQSEFKQREAKGEPNSAIDTQFVEALQTMNTQEYAGIGLGVERLAMILAGIEDIHQLSPIPTVQLGQSAASE